MLFGSPAVAVFPPHLPDPAALPATEALQPGQKGKDTVQRFTKASLKEDNTIKIN